MNSFLTQIKNDVLLNKKNLLNPVVLFIVLDVLAVIAYFVFKIHTGFSYDEVVKVDMQTEMELTSPEMIKVLWNFIGMGCLGVVGFVMVIVGASMSSAGLNLDNFRKCEIFYRSQPVNVWQYAGSKFLVDTIGPTIVMIALGFVNLLFAIPFIAPVFNVQILPALAGIFSSSVLYLKSLIVLGSIGFLASAVFREKAVLKLLLFLVAVQLSFVFGHLVFDTPMIDIIGYLGKLINPLQNLANFENFERVESFNEVIKYLNINTLIFNWHTLVQLIASAVFFVSSVLIYSRREVN